MQGSANGTHGITIVPVLVDEPASLGGTSCTTNNGNVPAISASSLNGFYNALTNSQYLSAVEAEYGLSAVGWVSTVSVTSPNTTCSFSPTDQNIQTWLVSWINANSVPLPNGGTTDNTIYALYLPPNINPGFIKGTGACAYNGAVGYTTSQLLNGHHLHYAVIPDENSGAYAGCGSNPNGLGVPGGFVNTTTFYSSHEIAEALTDPGPGLGWEADIQANCQSTAGCIWPSSGGQIGDMCVWTHAVIPGTSVMVQGLWSNAANECLVGFPGAAGDVSRSGASGIILGGTGAAGTFDAVASSTHSRTNALSFSEATDDGESTFDQSWSVTPNVKFVSGDFDGDGLYDIALTGPSGWGFVPVELTSHANDPVRFNGTGHVTKGLIETSPVPTVPNPGGTYPPASFALQCTGLNFPLVATQTLIPPVTGDFNGDGLSDIALIGGPNWTSIPVAFSMGNTVVTGMGANQIDFWSTNCTDGGLNSYFTAQTGATRPRLVAGDFNGDGFSDLALIGLQQGNPPTPLSTIIVSLSNGDGSFAPVDGYFTLISGVVSTQFNAWAVDPGVEVVTGDFNGDGLSDIALQKCGGGTWASTPIAYANGGNLGNGGSPGLLTQFVVGNIQNTTFAQDAAHPGAQLVAGDFDGDGVSDLALTGAPSFGTNIPMAFTNANRFSPPATNATFTFENSNGGAFNGWASRQDSSPAAPIVAMSASQGRFLAWTTTPGAGPVTGSGYAIGEDNNVYQWEQASQVWAAFGPTNNWAAFVTVDLNGTPWALDFSGNAYHWTGSSFASIGHGPTCAFQSLASGSNVNETWALDCNYHVWHYSTASGWVQQPGTALSGSKPAVFSNPGPCGDHLPWIIGTNLALFPYARTDNCSSNPTYNYQASNGAGEDLSTDFAIGEDGNLYQWNPGVGWLLYGSAPATPYGTSTRIGAWVGGIFAAEAGVTNATIEELTWH